MSFKLFCKSNPVALGIEDPSDGSWSLDKLAEHIKKCKACGKAKRALTFELQDVTKAFFHGGRRPGAGRKPFGEDKMVRVNIMLQDRHIDKAARIGDGNISAGVRRALEKIKR